MTDQPRKRARRDERRPEPKRIRLTPRDLDILHAVYECRILTTQHLQTLFFPSMHQAYNRLAALYHQGLLERHFMGIHADKMNTPTLYVLDKRGAALLQVERGIEIEARHLVKTVTFQFLEHSLAINTVRVAVTKACQQQGWRLMKWLGENDLKADYDYVTLRREDGRMHNVSVIPDSYFAIQSPRGTTHAVLELDRGKMTTGRFKTKIQAYQVYYDSGAYFRRFGTKSLRVLTVTLSAPRLVNLRRVTEEAQGKQRFWFTTLSQITPDTVLTAPIWDVATNDAPQPFIDLSS